MSSFESMRMAVQGVLANRLRSILTLLGITIGVAAVILLVAVGRGSAVAVETQIEGLGTNMLTVQAGGRSFGRGPSKADSFTFLTMKDVKLLQDKTQTPDVKTVTPVVDAQSVTGVHGTATETPSQVLGTTASYAANQAGTGGTLSVTDGLHTANIALLGQYDAAGFQTEADKTTGTLISYHDLHL